MRTRLAVVPALLAAATALAQAPGGPAERGRALYVGKMCYTCHGYAGQGGERGTGPQLAPGLWAWPAFAQQVRHPRQDMPRYPERYTSDAELADIYAFLAAIPPGKAAREIPLLQER